MIWFMMEEVQSKPIQPLENFSRVSETKQVALSSLRSRPSMICAVWGYADLHNFFAYQDRSPWNCQWELIWNLRKLLILWKAEKKYRRELSWSLMAPDQTVPEASPAPGPFSDANVCISSFFKPVWICFLVAVQEKTLESPLDCKEIKPINPKGSQPWLFIGRTDAEAPVLWPPDAKS